MDTDSKHTGNSRVCVVGGGLAGCECALTMADLGVCVDLYEMRPDVQTPVHTGSGLAELVCSNSLKSYKWDSAAGMQKTELFMLGSHLLDAAIGAQVAAGGALAVDRSQFSSAVTDAVYSHPRINAIRGQVRSLQNLAQKYTHIILATGPMTSPELAASIASATGTGALAFFDASAPVIMADSIDKSIVFSQSRYAKGDGDYLNAPFTRGQYDAFIMALLGAKRVIARDFETRELFQACQPIEEIARKGHDAARFGPLKPVGLTDPATGRRPWAALQLRREDAYGTSYNMVGFQTNLTFPEQQRVFRMIPGLEQAEFARFGVMHANTFLDAPRVLDASGRLACDGAPNLHTQIYVAGQLAGTEGYCEAIRSGMHVAFTAVADVYAADVPHLPKQTAFGALMDYATDPALLNYQPMHVNFGIMEPLQAPVKNKRARYEAYAQRGAAALYDYALALYRKGLATKKMKSRLFKVRDKVDEGLGVADAVRCVFTDALDIYIDGDVR